jgi:hypothetical protein
VRPKIRDGVGTGFGSKHLAKNVEIRPGAVPGHTKLYIPHYWARFVHDGRGPIPGPPRGGDAAFYVWYKDRRQDPRLAGSGGYPKRKYQVSKLSREEFIRDKKAGKLVFVKEVKKGVPPSPFFENSGGGGMSGFSAVASKIMRERWATYINRRLKSVMDLKGEVKIVLG